MSYNLKKMINKIVLLSLIALLSSSCATTKQSEIAEYPRMPDDYRNNDHGYRSNGNNVANRNPLGMSIYDAAETEAEENYFGVEVVPLEESQKILSERKKNQINKE